MTTRFLLPAALALASAAALAQAPAPSFEVASIKPSGPPDPAMMMSGKMRVGMTIDKGRVDIGFFSLADLIRTAYRVKAYQVSGPSWINTERFEIHAKLPEDASKEQVPEMLQALLAERFKLTVHRENKEQNTYALVVGKGGSKLKDALPDPEPPAADNAKGGANGGVNGFSVGTGEGQMRVNRTANGVTMSGGPAGAMKMSMSPGGMHMESAKMTMTMLTEMLTRFVDRPVLDMTELKGAYQVALDISLEDLKGVARMAGIMGPGMGGGDAGRAAAGAASDPSGGSIFSTVQQLGLKLEPRKAPVEMIVVDKLEKTPTEN